MAFSIYSFLPSWAYMQQKNSISAFQPYSFQRRRRYRTQLFPVLGFYSRQNEYIKSQICGNCQHVENLSSSTLFIITLFEIRIDVRICCWLLWLWNISWHCWNFECILMEKLFWWCNKESKKEPDVERYQNQCLSVSIFLTSSKEEKWKSMPMQNSFKLCH